MCGTCGCGSEENGFVISNPIDNKEQSHQHDHDHQHTHTHSHGHDGHHHEHTHSHDHSHPHDHTHAHKTIIEIEQDILQQNEIHAARNKGYFEAKNILALNLVSSPGSGKTSVLERTLTDLKDNLSAYVIEGDQQSLNDANRIAALDVPVLQINTGKGCHLESDMVYKAVKQLNMQDNTVLFIENVGNLVCPAMFNLGESHRVVIISTTEGVDKPIKYPDMFHTADVCLINKTDLLPYLNIDMEALKDNALKINPKLTIFEVSATTGEGMDAWYRWLKNEQH